MRLHPPFHWAACHRSRGRWRHEKCCISQGSLRAKKENLLRQGYRAINSQASLRPSTPIVSQDASPPKCSVEHWGSRTYLAYDLSTRFSLRKARKCDTTRQALDKERYQARELQIVRITSDGDDGFLIRVPSVVSAKVQWSRIQRTLVRRRKIHLIRCVRAWASLLSALCFHSTSGFTRLSPMHN